MDEKFKKQLESIISDKLDKITENAEQIQKLIHEINHCSDSIKFIKMMLEN